MYMSRLAAIKEFAFMKVRSRLRPFGPNADIYNLIPFGFKLGQVLHAHGFPVPEPIDQSRHCIIMSLIDAFPLSVHFFLRSSPTGETNGVLTKFCCCCLGKQ
jgi:RIO kinase 2